MLYSYSSIILKTPTKGRFLYALGIHGFFWSILRIVVSLFIRIVCLLVFALNYSTLTDHGGPVFDSPHHIFLGLGFYLLHLVLFTLLLGLYYHERRFLSGFFGLTMSQQLPLKCILRSVMFSKKFWQEQNFTDTNIF